MPQQLIVVVRSCYACNYRCSNVLHSSIGSRSQKTQTTQSTQQNKTNDTDTAVTTTPAPTTTKTTTTELNKLIQSQAKGYKKSTQDRTNLCNAVHGQSPVYFQDICSPIISISFRSLLHSADYDEMIVPRTRTVRMVRTVSVSWHPRFGTCCQLISKTVVLVANSSSRALRLGSLCKLTHKRRL